MEQLKAYPTLGVCGLDCGLCPRYYTVGPSRCPGCGGPGFSGKHPSCSFITCCVKKRGLEVCGQCGEYPCPKFKGEDEYRTLEGAPSYPPYRNVPANQRFVQAQGIEKFAALQAKRITLLEAMIAGYDDGRSRSFFCRAAALLDLKTLETSMKQAVRLAEAAGSGKMEKSERAQRLRGILAAAARQQGIELKSKR